MCRGWRGCQGHSPDPKTARPQGPAWSQGVSLRSGSFCCSSALSPQDLAQGRSWINCSTDKRDGEKQRQRRTEMSRARDRDREMQKNRERQGQRQMGQRQRETEKDRDKD